MSPKPLSIHANNVFYYYQDLDAATKFYVDLLGFEQVADYGTARMVQAATSAFLSLVDVRYGMPAGDEPKSVTTAFVTDELEAWYVYLTAQGVPMERPLEPQPDSAHDGFVALDPEGYFLEFERFNRHPENLRLMPILDALPARYSSAGASALRHLGVKATVTWLYYEEVSQGKEFLQQMLGLTQVVDQGFAAVYRSSHTGFLGPVQAGEGLHPFSDRKLVTPSLLTNQLEEWLLAMQTDGAAMRGSEIELAGSDVELFAVIDPAGYTFEFDQLRDTATNARLHHLLSGVNEFYVNA